MVHNSDVNALKSVTACHESSTFENNLAKGKGRHSGYAAVGRKLQTLIQRGPCVSSKVSESMEISAHFSDVGHLDLTHVAWPL